MRSGTNSNCHAPRASAETKWEKAKMHNLAENSFIFSCRESEIHPRQSQYEKSRFSALWRRDLGTSSPHVAILALKSSDLFVVYLSTLSTCSPFPTSRRRRRIAQLNTIRSVLCFFSFFFFLQLFYGPRSCGRSTYTMSLKREAPFFF